MASGLTSKSRPWFELLAPQGAPDSMPVRRWRYAVQNAMRLVLSKSNLYATLEQVYHSQGVFGTAAMSGVPDRNGVVHFAHYPAGSYCLDVNEKNEVDTFYRCYSMTPRQMAHKFGMEKLSPQSRMAAERGDLVWITVHHLVEPNPDADMRYVTNRSMPYKSTYWETSANGDNAGILRQSGFPLFPIAAPRWIVNGTNVYGTGPGHIA
ncbi:Bacteriophage head to tail connecting protein [compost metagenome]